jgi:hypothetical protein
MARVPPSGPADGAAGDRDRPEPIKKAGIRPSVRSAAPAMRGEAGEQERRNPPGPRRWRASGNGRAFTGRRQAPSPFSPRSLRHPWELPPRAPRRFGGGFQTPGFAWVRASSHPALYSLAAISAWRTKTPGTARASAASLLPRGGKEPDRPWLYLADKRISQGLLDVKRLDGKIIADWEGRSGSRAVFGS